MPQQVQNIRKGSIKVKDAYSGKLYGYPVYLGYQVWLFNVLLLKNGNNLRDYFWIRFDDEKHLTWDDVKHWKYHKV